MTRVARVALLGCAVVLGLSGLTACNGGDSPPSCAKDTQPMGMNQQNQCLTDVQNWCQKNYPDDLACANKVFGTDPRKLGDDS